MIMKLLPLYFLLPLAALLVAPLSAAAPDGRFTVTVSAGEIDRLHSAVSFDLPAGAKAPAYRLVDDRGISIDLQLDNGRAWFMLDHLPAGMSRTYTLQKVDAADAQACPVTARREDESVLFSVDGSPVFRYHAEPSPLPRPDIDSIYRRGGYIAPVRTPSGAVVTDDYPPNHLHHHGIWAAWTRTVFNGRTPDFWNMGQGTGTVEPVSLEALWSGSVHAGLRARHRYVDLTPSEPETALHEEWELRLLNVSDDVRLFDLIVTQHTATDSALYLPEYHYGGVGFRGHRRWNDADSTFILTSEGRDRSDAHATRARWFHAGGEVDGALAGIAILGHPDNYEAPQPMRIHPNEPFFNFAPSQAGDWSIQPGRPYVARYRFVVYDGAPDAEKLERLWQDYANPVEVLVE